MQGKWKNLYTYTNLHKKRKFFIIFSTYDVSEDFVEQVVENEWLYPRHAIVYIPKADSNSGKNWWKTHFKILRVCLISCRAQN